MAHCGRRHLRRLVRCWRKRTYVPHGLCENAANVLAEAGCSDHEIAAITGHRDLAMVQLLHPRGAELSAAANRSREAPAGGRRRNRQGHRASCDDRPICRWATLNAPLMFPSGTSATSRCNPAMFAWEAQSGHAAEILGGLESDPNRT